MLTKFFFKCHALIHWNKNRTQYFVLCVLPIGLGLREFFYVQNIIPLVVNHFSPPLCFSYIKMWERFRTFHFFNWQSQEVTTALYCMTLCNTTCLYWLNNRTRWEIKIDIRFLSQLFFTIKLNFRSILFHDNKSFCVYEGKTLKIEKPISKMSKICRFAKEGVQKWFVFIKQNVYNIQFYC